MTVLEGIDLLEDTWAKGVPLEQFERLRREAPVYWHPEEDGSGFWAVTKHADVVHASRHPLGADHRGGGVGPALQQAEEQARLAPEVVVHRARGALGPLGDRVDRRRLDAARGEELRGRGEQPLPRLRSALPLGGHHRNIAVPM